jgi:hypothetical protein
LLNFNEGLVRRGSGNSHKFKVFAEKKGINLLNNY